MRREEQRLQIKNKEKISFSCPYRKNKQHFDQKSCLAKKRNKTGHSARLVGNTVQQKKQVILFLKHHVYNSRDCNDLDIQCKCNKTTIT